MSIEEKIFKDFFKDLESKKEISLNLLKKLKEIKKSKSGINQEMLLKVIKEEIKHVD